MLKKLPIACAALIAYAIFVVLPAPASATNDPELTHPTGTLLSTGSVLKGTNLGETAVTGPQKEVFYRCPKLVMTTTLTKNNGSEVEGDIETLTFEGTGTGMACTSVTINANPATNGLPWCIRSTPAMTTDEFQIRGDSCANKPRAIRVEINGCAYERAATKPITGTYSTHPEAALLSLTNVEFLKVNFFCISPTFLDMVFTIETDTEGENQIFLS